jgi:hypothetical protein
MVSVLGGWFNPESKQIFFSGFNSVILETNTLKTGIDSPIPPPQTKHMLVGWPAGMKTLREGSQVALFD